MENKDNKNQSPIRKGFMFGLGAGMAMTLSVYQAVFHYNYKFDADGRLLDPSQNALCRFEVEVLVTGSADIPASTTTQSLAKVILTGSNIVTHRIFEDQFHLPDNGYR